MIEILDRVIFFLGSFMVGVGCLFSLVLIFFLIDEAVTMITKYLKIYPMLIDFIWERVHKKERRPHEG